MPARRVSCAATAPRANRTCSATTRPRTFELLFRLPAPGFAALDVPPETLMEVRSLAGSIRRSFLGHELKSFEVLASILGSG